MANFKPSGPFTVPMQLLIPTSTMKKGSVTKEYPTNGILFFGTFRTFGGTERTVNDTIVVENTAVVETWYRPDIQADCRVIVGGIPYEILGTPENIAMRNQYLLFKVRAIKGGA